MIFRYLKTAIIQNSLSKFYKFELKRGVRKRTLQKTQESESKSIEANLAELPPAAQKVLKSNSEFIGKNSNNTDLNKKNINFNFNDSKIQSLIDEISQLDSNLDPLNLEEDPKFVRSKANCSGCGAQLQCNDKQKEGFVDARKFKLLNKQELNFTICFRCEFLKTKKKILNLTSNSIDYDNFILKKIISNKKAHVVILIDLLDLPNSIYDGWSKLIQENSSLDIILLGNKFDLLPNTGPKFEHSVIKSLSYQCLKKGLKGPQIKHVDIISAKTGFNLERVISKFFEFWNDEGDVYLLGMANAGKSVLFNKLLSSDYCRPLASEALIRATTSFWPGTTLNMLKFPITFMNDKKLGVRHRRLKSEVDRLVEIETKRAKRYEKTHDLKDAEVFGLVGCSFKKYSVQGDEIDFENAQATYSIDEATGMIAVAENFENNKDLKQKFKKDAREIYKPEIFLNKATWFYDTPGVLGSQKILQNFSKKELEIIFPQGLIMPRIYWMVPGQTLLVGGLIRIDLLEVFFFKYFSFLIKFIKSTGDERVLFSIMASPALPVINPFKTETADETYEKYYNQGNVLRVPHIHNLREQPLPSLKSKTFEISCVGNHMAMSDIVFSCFG